MPRRIFGDVVKGVDVTNGANAASKSVLAAGKTSTGKQVPFSVGADGKLSLEVDAVTATNVGIDQSDPGVSNKVVAELSGSNAIQAIDEETALNGVAGSRTLIAKRYISVVNYGPGDLKVNIDAATTESGAFTIRAGDSRQIDCQCTTLHWLSAGDTVFTAVGV
jgi:hypothetical protein